MIVVLGMLLFQVPFIGSFLLLALLTLLYGFGLGAAFGAAEEDIKVLSKGINVYVDPQSRALLQGSEIDYVDTLMGAGFTVNNPNAVSGCGCGSSFTVTSTITPSMPSEPVISASRS